MASDELMPVHHETDMSDRDVYFTHWQCGGASATRCVDPRSGWRDVSDGTVSATSSGAIYGVVLDGSGNADLLATDARRTELRRERAGLAN